MPKHILCADDSVTMQKVVAITFAHTDYQVTSARSADEAVVLARQNRPDLVLADAVMPGKTGYDLCQALKSDPNLRSVPVVILCGNSAAYDEARGKQVGADGSLIKPWDSQVLVEKIGEILSRAVSQGVAHPTTAGVSRPAAPPVPVQTPQAQRPTITSGIGIPAQRPSPAAPAMARPAPIAAPSPRPAMASATAPATGAELPRPPAGLPRPPLIRGAPIYRPAGAPAPGAPSQAVLVPRPSSVPPAVVPRPTPMVHPAAAAAPPAAASPPRRQATIMGMPAMNLPPAPGAVTAPHPPRPPVHAPPVHAPPVHAPPVQTSPYVAPRPVPGPPPTAPARPLPGSEALARAAQRVASATAAAAGVDARGPEYDAIIRLSREIIEQIAWEVVPELAEIIIRERLNELKK